MNSVMRVRRQHWTILAAVCACLLGLPLLAAYDVSRIYSDATLGHWQQKYRDSVQWNFDNLVLGSLTPSERRQLGQVQLRLPLRGPGEARGDPMLFYAQQQAVVAPIQSILFFDQLSQAMAYLSVKQLSPEPVYDYLAMLKYRDLGSTTVTDPIAALGIPPEPWKLDKRIDNASQQLLKTAIVWILAHELGHLYHRHPGYGPGVKRSQAQQNELQADRFANELMRRIGVAPSGMAAYFMAMAYWSPHRGDFTSDQAWQRFLREQATHPLTAARMRELAASLAADAEGYAAAAQDPAKETETVRYVAKQILGIAEILEDPRIQRSIAAKGRATSPASLARSLPGAGQSAQQPPTSMPFSGSYQGTWVHHTLDGYTESLSASMQLKRQGNRVSGWYQFGLGEGLIEGIIQGQRLQYQWQWGGASGYGTLQAQPNGSLSGEWGYRDSDTGGGSWLLTRTPDP